MHNLYHLSCVTDSPAVRGRCSSCQDPVLGPGHGWVAPSAIGSPAQVDPAGDRTSCDEWERSRLPYTQHVHSHEWILPQSVSWLDCKLIILLLFSILCFLFGPYRLFSKLNFEFHKMVYSVEYLVWRKHFYDLAHEILITIFISETFVHFRDIDGAIVRPLPRIKRVLSDSICLPHIVQVLVC